MTHSGTPPVFAQLPRYDARHRCKHTMGFPIRVPPSLLQSLPHRHVSRDFAYDDPNRLLREVAPASQQKGQSQSTLSSGRNDALFVDQIPHQS